MRSSQRQSSSRVLPRRNVLRGAAVGAAGVGAIALVGCGDDDDDASSGEPTSQASPGATTAGSPTAAVKRGGTLRYGRGAEGDQVYDPAITIHTVTYSTGMGLTYSRLLRYDGQFNILPELAERLPEQPDQLTYVFKLRPDVKWHNLPPANGRPFTAADAVFGLQRFTKANPEFVYGAKLTPIDKYEVMDERTFKLTTKAPFAPMLVSLADDAILMVNKENVELVGDAGIKKYENQLGTGPWMRGELKPNISAFLKPNPDYYLKGQPYLERIEYQSFPDAAAQKAAFLAGQFDSFMTLGAGGTLLDAEELRGSLGSDKVAFRKKLHTATQDTYMNTSKPPFNDPRVRKAVHLAIDRQAAITAQGKDAAILMGAVPQLFPKYARSEQDLLKLPGFRSAKADDLAEAKKLLSSAAVTSLSLDVPTQGQGHAVTIQQNLKAIGIDIAIKPATGADYFAKRAKGEFEMNIGLNVGGSDPDVYLYERYHSGAGVNFTQYKNANVDRLTEQQRQTLDASQRAQIIRQIEDILLEEAPQAFTASLVFYPIFRSYVKGIPERVPSGLTHNLAEIWLDK